MSVTQSCWARTVFWAVLSVWLAGCSSLGRPSPVRQAFDLGPLDLQAEGRSLPNLRRVRVNVPVWLDGNAMLYRLSYDQPERLQAFRDSYWVAPVGQLLQRHLARALSGDVAAPTGGGCDLVLVLDEFNLVFSVQGQGDAVLAGSLNLYGGEGGAAVLRHPLRLHEALTGAGAESGVRAQRRLLQGLIRESEAWLAGLDRAGGQRFNTGSYCR